MLHKTKDVAVSVGIAAVLRERYRHLAHITRCDLDSRRRRLVIHAKVRVLPIIVRITVESYRLEPRGVITWIVPQKISATPFWIEPFLRWRHTGRAQPLPAPVAALL